MKCHHDRESELEEWDKVALLFTVFLLPRTNEEGISKLLFLLIPKMRLVEVIRVLRVSSMIDFICQPNSKHGIMSERKVVYEDG